LGKNFYREVIGTAYLIIRPAAVPHLLDFGDYSFEPPPDRAFGHAAKLCNFFSTNYEPSTTNSPRDTST